ncbi:uncharacterized protein MYCFIDRAFT_176297 [Pseudocercospora fijiensis CIRAD86]|uniref:F-box domain-containing protein n=1 Tax=Pseudocercospora fijiensis (strain CIRAD86) TaxID=383855 RepID=M3ATY2_PSEFD|nr:uncharacterized protein MYCFIDRAFT_176297 [Pseudocercospora fijiensis CIRAD86]EME80947.1 hypothetical protein MYCFIDRAFT_176297 [Pseudocercospora fijiensis CIRAD86]
MRFTHLIRLPSHLLLLIATISPRTFASPTTSSSNSTTSWCLSTTTGTGPLYLFNPAKSCSDQIVTFTPEIMQATDICRAGYQKYHFKMCGKNVTLSVNAGPKSLVGVKQMGAELSGFADDKSLDEFADLWGLRQAWHVCMERLKSLGVASVARQTVFASAMIRSQEAQPKPVIQHLPADIALAMCQDLDLDSPRNLRLSGKALCICATEALFSHIAIVSSPAESISEEEIARREEEEGQQKAAREQNGLPFARLVQVHKQSHEKRAAVFGLAGPAMKVCLCPPETLLHGIRIGKRPLYDQMRRSEVCLGLVERVQCMNVSFAASILTHQMSVRIRSGGLENLECVVVSGFITCLMPEAVTATLHL